MEFSSYCFSYNSQVKSEVVAENGVGEGRRLGKSEEKIGSKEPRVY